MSETKSKSLGDAATDSDKWKHNLAIICVDGKYKSKKRRINKAQPVLSILQIQGNHVRIFNRNRHTWEKTHKERKLGLYT